MEPGNRFSEERVRIDFEEAYVLHCRAYRETSLLVDVFTRNFGRFRLVAKGARRGRGEAGRLLQPFKTLRISWTGKGGLAVLVGVEPGPSMQGLTGAALFCGFYVNELLLGMLAEHDAHPGVFELYQGVVEELNAQGCDEIALRLFELNLLDQLGYGLALESDSVSGEPIHPDERYQYLFDQGPVQVSTGQVESISGATLLALQSRCFDDPTCRQEAKWLMRRVIRYHLNGRTLKSRELFKQFNEH